MFCGPIRPGALVRLRSGGPEMTAVKKIPACWECSWFEGGERRSATFVEFELATRPGALGYEGGDSSGFTIFLDTPS